MIENGQAAQIPIKNLVKLLKIIFAAKKANKNDKMTK
jgi:hypothetical protein